MDVGMDVGWMLFQVACFAIAVTCLAVAFLKGCPSPPPYDFRYHDDDPDHLLR